MTITEQQAIEMARYCGATVYDPRGHALTSRELTAFANLALASVEAENVKLREALVMVDKADAKRDFLSLGEMETIQDALALPTSTEHLDAIVAERVKDMKESFSRERRAISMELEAAEEDAAMLETEVIDLRAKLAAVESKLAECQRDAEKWREYQERKRRVIEAGMGKNPLRDAAIASEKEGKQHDRN